jgi:uncharacterized protein YkwD
LEVKLRALFTTFSTTLVVAGLAAVWSVASPLSAGCAAATPPDQLSLASSESSQFVAAINQLRESKGLNDLIVSDNLSSIATNWAVTMAGQDNIFHRSDLSDGVTLNWKRLGENVGVGPSVGNLMDAFIASPHHYENLVDPSFTHVGVGSVRTPDGLMYTAHEFASVVGYSTAVKPASNPAPAPAPVVTSPRTYTPRVTTPHVSAPRTTTPPAPPTTTPPTTAAPAEVVRSMSHDNELNDGSGNDQQKQNNKSDGRCGAQSGHKVVAAGGSAAVDRAA